MKRPHSALASNDTCCLWGVYFHMFCTKASGSTIQVWHIILSYNVFFLNYWNYWRVSIDENSWAHLKLKIALFIKTQSSLDNTPTPLRIAGFIIFFKQTLPKHYFIYGYFDPAFIVKIVVLSHNSAGFYTCDIYQHKSTWCGYIVSKMNSFTLGRDND